MGARLGHTWAEPAIYDTNIWVHGLTENVAAATDLVNAAFEDRQFVSVSAYIFEEVRITFESGHVDSEVVDAHLTDFSTAIHGCQNVSDPPMEAVAEMAVHQIRQSPQAQTVGAATGSQPKDAPILWHGHQLAQEGRDVTIYTADEDFSECSPPRVPSDGTLQMAFVE